MSIKVALVLGSGGARGYAHIGVIEELERRGYTINCIAGCSIGAVVGGIYAAGHLPQYKAWVEGLDYLGMMRLLDVSFSLGAIRGDKVFGHIRDLVGEMNIEDLPIPFTAVAADLSNQQEIWFQEGCLHQAMRASAAIPSLFTPVTLGNRVLVDGGLLNPIPIVPVVSSRSDMVIAVNLSASNNKHYRLPAASSATTKSRVDKMLSSLSSHLPRRGGPSIIANEPTLTQDIPKSAEGSHVIDVSGPGSMLELINQSFEVMQNSLAQYKMAGYPPDVLVNIPRRACRFFEFHRAQELIELGRVITQDALDNYENRQY